MSAADSLVAEVMAQPAPARLEYALGLLRFYLDPVPEFLQGCARLGLHLSARDCRILHALDRRRGGYVSAAALQAAAFVDLPCEDWADPRGLYMRISYIRRRLDLAALPVAINTWRGVGFCLDAPADFHFEQGRRPGAAVRP